MAERLLDHDPAPLVVGVVGKAGPPQLLHHLWEGRGWNRQVEGVVAAGAAALVELLDRHGQRVERARIAELAGHEVHALRQLLPDVLPEWGPGMLLDRLVGD